MTKLTRSEAIEDLRKVLLELVDEETSLCAAVSREGLFCRGFSQWTTEELRRRLPTDEPHDRKRLEEIANRLQCGRQSLLMGTLPCDDSSCRRDLCGGWAEFYEPDLARFHDELCGGQVRVIPDELD